MVAYFVVLFLILSAHLSLQHDVVGKNTFNSWFLLLNGRKKVELTFNVLACVKAAKGLVSVSPDSEQ